MAKRFGVIPLLGIVVTKSGVLDTFRVWRPPFRWDEDRRFLLRCELDAAYFHLYGIARDDVAYIMDTFCVWKEREEKQVGEYRTKRVILEIYGEMARDGEAYVTRLVPGPADPAVAHEPRLVERLEASD